MPRRLLAIGVLSLACASPPSTDAAHGALWGYVRLAPKSGSAGETDAYADRRLRGAARFDYAHPKFAVVYAAEVPAAHAPPRAAAMESERGEVRWRPAHVALARGDTLAIANHTARVQVVSAPAAGWVRELAPGESVDLVPATSGELEVHALGASPNVLLVWVAPGAFCVADAAGRYELGGLPPGPTTIGAWHPRLPPMAGHPVVVTAGEAARLDLAIGVDHVQGDAW